MKRKQKRKSKNDETQLMYLYFYILSSSTSPAVRRFTIWVPVRDEAAPAAPANAAPVTCGRQKSLNGLEPETSSRGFLAAQSNSYVLPIYGEADGVPGKNKRCISICKGRAVICSDQVHVTFLVS